MNSVVGVAPDVELHVLDREGVGVAIQDDLGVGDVLDDGGEVLVQLLHLDGHVGNHVRLALRQVVDVGHGEGCRRAVRGR